MEGGTRRLMRGLVNQMLFYVSFMALCSQNVSYQTRQRSTFLIGLYSNPRLWSRGIADMKI